MAHAVSPGGHRHQVRAVREEDLKHRHAVREKHQQVGTAEGDQQLVEHVGGHAPEISMSGNIMSLRILPVQKCHYAEEIAQDPEDGSEQGHPA